MILRPIAALEGFTLNVAENQLGAVLEPNVPGFSETAFSWRSPVPAQVVCEQPTEQMPLKFE